MSDTSTESNNQSGITSEFRRKRINRMKALIIVIVSLLLVLPTIICIILGIQVNRLQKQMKALVNIHSEYGLIYDTGDENLAYAAEKSSSELTEADKVVKEDITTIEVPSNYLPNVLENNTGNIGTVENNNDIIDNDKNNNTGSALSGLTSGPASDLDNDTSDVNPDTGINTEGKPGSEGNTATVTDAGTESNTYSDGNADTVIDTATLISTATDINTDSVTNTDNNADTDNNTDTDTNTISDNDNTISNTGTNQDPAAGIMPDSFSEADNATDTSADSNTEDAVNTQAGAEDNMNFPVYGSNVIDNPSYTGIYEGKTVYLTFDDGPSIYTGQILDILAEYNVKATFFVTGKTDKESKKLYKRIVDEGHTLGMHSYSHNYENIYKSVEDFDKDFTKLWKLLYDTTGYKPSIYRFPGGSHNKVNNNGMEDFIRYLNEASIEYFDWNVVSGDATGVKYNKEQLVANVLNGVAEKKRSIVLMHDARSKEATVESLPELLNRLILGGAQILPLDNNVTPIQMIKADSIN